MDYTYTSARVSALEGGLMSRQNAEALAMCKSADDCVKMLNSFGYKGENAEEIILNAKQKKQKIISELIENPKEIEILFYEKTFHNLKAAVKKLYAPHTIGKLYVDEALVSGEEFEEKINAGKYEALPEYCRDAAKEAYKTIIRTGDGRLSDIIIDRACMDAAIKFGEKTKHEILKKYAREFVTVSNIKIALRFAGDDTELLDTALAEGANIPKAALIKACSDKKTLNDFLNGCGYSDVTADNIDIQAKQKIITTIKPEKYNIFSPAPTINYIINLENEISLLRLILVCKTNGVNNEFIKRRVVMSYDV